MLMHRQTRDIDTIIRRVIEILPIVNVSQLKATHPVDDDGIWYFFVQGDDQDIQLESSLGMCPFIVETVEQNSNRARTAETVENAVSMIVEYLSRRQA
ncbi:MAG: hypothetical protein QM785_16770 [Pyrinomonadaceae bacterium]